MPDTRLYQDFTNTELKEILKKLKLSTTRKAELLTRILSEDPDGLCLRLNREDIDKVACTSAAVSMESHENPSISVDEARINPQEGISNVNYSHELDLLRRERLLLQREIDIMRREN